MEEKIKEELLNKKLDFINLKERIVEFQNLHDELDNLVNERESLKNELQNYTTTDVPYGIIEEQIKNKQREIDEKNSRYHELEGQNLSDFETYKKELIDVMTIKKEELNDDMKDMNARIEVLEGRLPEYRQRLEQIKKIINGKVIDNEILDKDPYVAGLETRIGEYRQRLEGIQRLEQNSKNKVQLSQSAMERRTEFLNVLSNMEEDLEDIMADIEYSIRITEKELNSLRNQSRIMKNIKEYNEAIKEIQGYKIEDIDNYIVEENIQESEETQDQEQHEEDRSEAHVIQETHDGQNAEEQENFEGDNQGTNDEQEQDDNENKFKALEKFIDLIEHPEDKLDGKTVLVILNTFMHVSNEFGDASDLDANNLNVDEFEKFKVYFSRLSNGINDLYQKDKITKAQFKTYSNIILDISKNIGEVEADLEGRTENSSETNQEQNNEEENVQKGEDESVLEDLVEKIGIIAKRIELIDMRGNMTEQEKNEINDMIKNWETDLNLAYLNGKIYTDTRNEAIEYLEEEITPRLEKLQKSRPNTQNEEYSQTDNNSKNSISSRVKKVLNERLEYLWRSYVDLYSEFTNGETIKLNDIEDVIKDLDKVKSELEFYKTVVGNEFYDNAISRIGNTDLGLKRLKDDILNKNYDPSIDEHNKRNSGNNGKAHENLQENAESEKKEAMQRITSKEISLRNKYLAIEKGSKNGVKYSDAEELKNMLLGLNTELENVKGIVSESYYEGVKKNIKDIKERLKALVHERGVKNGKDNKDGSKPVASERKPSKYSIIIGRDAKISCSSVSGKTYEVSKRTIKKCMKELRNKKLRYWSLERICEENEIKFNDKHTRDLIKDLVEQEKMDPLVITAIARSKMDPIDKENMIKEYIDDCAYILDGEKPINACNVMYNISDLNKKGLFRRISSLFGGQLSNGQKKRLNIVANNAQDLGIGKLVMDSPKRGLFAKLKDGLGNVELLGSGEDYDYVDEEENDDVVSNSTAQEIHTDRIPNDDELYTGEIKVDEETLKQIDERMAKWRDEQEKIKSQGTEEEISDDNEKLPGM